MKNANLFPFERNKYFYGKLLSVEDFELEQKYMNDKRRMQNRFLFGAGVVAGLYVVPVDEQTLSVEAGLAFDCWGRELVVDAPVTGKLSLLDGFDECMRENTDILYLCLEYDETETEPVHNIAGNTLNESMVSYNKIKEGCHLFLTDREPEDDKIRPAGWVQRSQVVYREGDIRITQCMPRYIQADKTAEITIQIENRGRDNLSFSYTLVLNHLLSEGTSKIEVSFDEVLFERCGYYEITYPIQASSHVSEEGTAVIDSESVMVMLSGIKQEVFLRGQMAAEIVDVDEKEAVCREYYRTSMENILRIGQRQPVYLARIHLVRAPETYIIENVENVPFGQYVSNLVTVSAVNGMMEKELRLLEKNNGEAGKETSRAGRGRESREEIEFARGTAEISLDGGGMRGAKFFSREIVHSLGLGAVSVVLGLEKESGKVVYGSSEIFENPEESGVDAELAACVNEESGSFVIGARLLSTVSEGTLRIHWCAVRDKEENEISEAQKRIFIKPNLLELAVRQSHYLEAVCENMVEKAVLWSVKEEGGFIDENGLYTAPNVPGVYEVVAQSAVYEEVRASIFIVVRKEESET